MSLARPGLQLKSGLRAERESGGPMSRSPTGPVWFLVAVASLLASLLGVVASGGRASSSPRSIAPIADWNATRTSVELSAPRISGTVIDAPDASGAKAPAPPARSEQTPASERLTGIVLRPEGEPAAGARVVLGQADAHCDEQGRFELTLKGDEGPADLAAFEPGHEPALRAAFGATLGRGGEHSVRLVLGPETLSLGGTVTDPDGVPVEGWTVELEGPDPLRDFGFREAVRSGQDGSFVLCDVSAGVHVVLAWKERRTLPFRSAPAAAGETGLTIVVVE